MVLISAKGKKRAWCVISGLASEISLFIFLITPICSSEFNKLYFSSLPGTPGLLGAPALALYVSSDALLSTTIRRWVLLSVAGSGTCCSAVRRGSEGGGRDWVPVMLTSEGGDIVLNSVVWVARFEGWIQSCLKEKWGCDM